MIDAPQTSPATYENDLLDAAFGAPAVTVIGASASDGVTSHLLRNVRKEPWAFPGPIHLVNLKRPTIEGLTAFADASEVSGPLGLVYLQVPAAICLQVLSKLPQRPAGVITYAAGFAEAGNSEGERQLANWGWQNRVPIFGPQSVGIADFHRRALHTNLPLDGARLAAGHVALIAQSGGLLIGLLRAVADRNLGASLVASTGNQAMLSAARIGTYFLRRPETQVLLMYVENPGSLADLEELGRVSEQTGKRVVLAWGGVSKTGVRAARSHTGAIVESRRAVEGVLEQFGLVLVRDLEELVSGAEALHVEPALRSWRGPTGVAVFTGSGAGTVISADLLERNGIEIQPLAQSTREQLGVGPSELGNPFDFSGGVVRRTGRMQELANALAADPGVGLVADLFATGVVARPPLTEMLMSFVNGVRSAGRIAILALPIRISGDEERAKDLADHVIVGNGAPDTLAKLRVVLGLMRREPFVQSETLPLGAEVVEHSLNATAESIISGLAGRARLAGIRVRWPLEHEISTLSELRSMRAEIALPAVVKSESGMAHRANAGGILFASSWSQVENAAGFMLDRFGSKVSVAEKVEFTDAFFVGLEIRSSGLRMIAFGKGGDRFDDERATVRLWPLSAAQLERMLSRFTADAALVVRLSEFISDLVSAAESLEGLHYLDVNPVVVGHDGQLVILDAKIHFHSAT